MKKSTSVKILAGLAIISSLSLTGCGKKSADASKVKLASGNSLDAVAVYTFDDGVKGGSVADASGKKNNATASGSANVADGKFGKALVFNGSDVFLTLPEAVLDNNELTFAAWINPSDIPMWARVADMGNGGVGNDIWFGFSDTHSLRLDILNEAGPASMIAKKKPQANTWTHVAFTYGNGKLCLYVNGELNKDLDYTPQPKEVVADKGAASERGIFIGKSNWADPLFVGQMDDILFASRVYSQDEIKEIMEKGIIH